MKLKRSEIITGYRALEAVRPFLKTAMAGFSAAALRRRLEDIVKPFEEAMATPASVVQYDGERLRLCAQMAVKDEQGNPRIIKGQNGVQDSYDLSANRAEFDVAVAAIRAKYQADIDEWEQKARDFQRMLDEPIELNEQPCLKLSGFKDDAGPSLDALFPFIIDDSAPAPAAEASKP